MRPALLAPLLLTLLAPPAQARRAKGGGRRAERHDAYGAVKLDGQPMRVRWSDGDSFNFQEGPYAGQGTRLLGYNTLEAYGPVHRWGQWTPQELYQIAKGSSQVAASQTWACHTSGEEDAFGRLLVDCPELTREMLRQGQGMAYFVEGKAPRELLELQREAMARRVGMWAKGAPRGIVTSLHSADEDKVNGSAYNRVADTRTGAALPRLHKRTYAECEEVCETTEGERSCMLYVPFEHRYHGQPDCLR